MPGIDQLKKGVDFVTTIAQSLDKALADKKVSLQEGLGLLWDARPAIDLFKAREEFWTEAVDVDPEERDALVVYFEDKFDISNDEAEGIVEDYIYWLEDTFTLYKKTVAFIKRRGDVEEPEE
jgi:hypothetical protein